MKELTRQQRRRMERVANKRPCFIPDASKPISEDDVFGNIPIDKEETNESETPVDSNESETVVSETN